MNGPTEFVKRPLELRIYGQEVKLNRPNFGMCKQWRKKLADASKEGSEMDVIGELFKDCGMNAEILESLEIEHLKAIQELLLGEKKS